MPVGCTAPCRPKRGHSKGRIGQVSVRVCPGLPCLASGKVFGFGFVAVSGPGASGERASCPHLQEPGGPRCRSGHRGCNTRSKETRNQSTFYALHQAHVLPLEGYICGACMPHAQTAIAAAVWCSAGAEASGKVFGFDFVAISGPGASGERASSPHLPRPCCSQGCNTCRAARCLALPQYVQGCKAS